MELKRIIEAVLFSSARPITAKQMTKRMDDLRPQEVLEALNELIAEYNSTDRAVSIVEVSGGYYEANKSATGNTYTVVRKDGKWSVTGDREDWIS